jgi:hypothetical protein
MDDPEELELVVKALTSGLSNCVLWKDDRTTQRLIGDRFLLGWTPKAIKAELIRLVSSDEVKVWQSEEVRDDYRDDHDHVYAAILPIEDFEYGLYVEMVLVDPDPEVPCVSLVNAHPQDRRKRTR